METALPAAAQKAFEYSLAVRPAIVDEDPPGHTAHRQALRRAFTLARIAAMEPRVPEPITERIEEQAEITQTLGKFWQYCKNHVDRLIENPGQDAVNAFIEGMREISGCEPLDRQYLTTVTFSIIFAGHETTTNASATSLHALLENREQWQRLCGTPSLIQTRLKRVCAFTYRYRNGGESRRSRL